MTILKRCVVIVFVVAGISAAVLLYLRRGPSAAPEGPPPELVSLVPPDAPYLLYADLVALRASPFLRQLEALAPPKSADRDYAEFVRATGFDYSRDLDRVLVVGRVGSAQPHTFAFAEGRFDRGKIESYALHTGKVERQNGVEVYLVPAGSPAKTVALAFLDNNRMALADGPTLEPVLARAAGGPDAALRERISRVAGAALFAVGRSAPLPENFSIGGMRSEQFANLARSLRWLTLAARPESDRMRVFLEGECDTDENARQLAGMLDGLRVVGQTLLVDPKNRRRM